jgi:putative endopeptidase
MNKYRGTTLICTTVLTILLGIGIQTQTAKADETSSNVQTEQTTKTNVITPATNNINSSDVNNSLVVQPDQTIDNAKYDNRFAGGDFNITPEQATPQNNYYVAVNKDTIEAYNKTIRDVQQAVQNGASVVVSSPTSPQQKVVTNGFDEINSGQQTADSPNTAQAADYYQRMLDQLSNENPDIEDYKADIQKIDGLKNYQDFANAMVELEKNGFELPFQLDWMSNVQNRNDNVLEFDQPSTLNGMPSNGLDDYSISQRSYYYQSLTPLFNQLGYTDAQAKKILDNALSFNDILNANSSDESTDAFKNSVYATPQMMPLTSFYQSTGNLDFQKYIEATYPNAKQIQVVDQGFYKRISSVFNTANFEKMKDWIITLDVTNHFYYFGKLGLDSFDIGSNSGLTAEDHAFSALEDTFSDVISTYYGEQTLPQDEIDKVYSMVNQIISTYETRFENNPWLSDAGKAAVIDKLKSISVNVGYPKTIPTSGDYTSLDFSSDKSIYQLDREISNYHY